MLILLDCCASGLSNTDEGKYKILLFESITAFGCTTNNVPGNGVTELLAACAFNNIANGVGPYSFTHALISQLRKLAHLPFFTVGYLYNLLFAKIQSLEIDDVSRKKAPIHLVLTQDNLLPRSIRISAKRVCPRLNRPSNNLASEGLPLSNNERNFVPDFIEQDAASSQSSQISSGVFSPDSGGESSSSSITQLPEYPRILLSIRVNESIKPNELSPELFAEWLGTIPLLTKSVRVEAGFASDSTLLMVSVPIAVLGYLPKDPAITMLGVTRSTNMLSTVDDHPPTLPNILELGEDDIVEDRQQDTQDSGFEDMSIFYDDKMESPKAWRDTPKMVTTFEYSSIGFALTSHRSSLHLVDAVAVIEQKHHSGELVLRGPELFVMPAIQILAEGKPQNQGHHSVNQFPCPWRSLVRHPSGKLCSRVQLHSLQNHWTNFPF